MLPVTPLVTAIFGDCGLQHANRVGTHDGTVRVRSRRVRLEALRWSPTLWWRGPCFTSALATTSAAAFLTRERIGCQRTDHEHDCQG
jgi:hypothetical protein